MPGVKIGLGQYTRVYSGPGYILACYTGLPPVLVPIAYSPTPTITRRFSIHFFHLPLDFSRVSSLRPTYLLHPFGLPFTQATQRLGTGSDTRCCGLRG